MAKKVNKVLKMVVPGGKAAPGVPLGPVLGGAGVNIGEFIKQFNADTADKNGMLMNVVLTSYDDRTFDYVIKSSPMSALVKAKIGIEKGSGKNNLSTAGKITRKQMQEIAEDKMQYTNGNDIDAVIKMIEGTCRSMGVRIVD